MSRRDDTIPMRHMLDHAREVVAMVRGRVRRDVDTDRMLQLSVTRILEIIGEAANRVTQQGRAQYPDIPWQDVINTRNRIIHGYDTSITTSSGESSTMSCLSSSRRWSARCPDT